MYLYLYSNTFLKDTQKVRFANMEQPHVLLLLKAENVCTVFLFNFNSEKYSDYSKKSSTKCQNCAKCDQKTQNIAF